MEKLERGKILKDWLEKVGLKRFELTNIAFVPRRTFEDIMNGNLSLPARHRLFLATELEIFKLTEMEKEQYEIIKRSKPEILKDELIANHFIVEWNAEKKIPKGDDRLSIDNHDGNSKKELTNILYKKYVLTNMQERETTAINAKSSPIIDDALKELRKVSKQSQEKFIEYLKDNSKNLKSLTSILNVIFSDGPEEAHKRLNKISNL